MEHQHTNHLIDQTSPYLLQHAHNPVDWYPWSEEALKKAKEENKMIIVSIGYAACHWCHVMERECFEDEECAKVMNDNYVSIKVDREERPDIDKLYMDAVMLMGQNGGWPLNIVALPDGRPIWGGTYFPKANWINALTQIGELWKNDPNKAYEYATNLSNGLKSLEVMAAPGNIELPDEEFTKDLVNNWKPNFDMVDGGPNRAPKFPMPSNYQFLLQYSFHQQDPVINEILTLTLTKMSFGGIYDHVGGGFARYSVDSFWKVPHFEKMLYDNGQLVSLFSDAWRVYRDDWYQEVVAQTLEYTAREMTSPEGGFYSSLDADSEGEEGKFYIWKAAEIKEILGEDGEMYMAYYNATEAGNWEHGNNILLKKKTARVFSAELGMSEENFRKKISELNQKMLKARESRVRPGLDDKILASWNALMLKGYIDAYRAFNEPEYLEVALKNATFIKEKFANGEGLYRNYKEGKASINAFLDDYALVIQAYLDLYEVTTDDAWLFEANRLMTHTVQHFYNEENGSFYYTSDEDPVIISRKTELDDNVIPASNSVMAHNLFRLYHLIGKEDYELKADKILNLVKERMGKYPGAYSNYLCLLLKRIHPFFEIAIAGDAAKGMIKSFYKSGYLPNILLVGGTKDKGSEIPLLENRFVENQTNIYVCQNKACKLPVKETEEALKLIIK